MLRKIAFYSFIFATLSNQAIASSSGNNNNEDEQARLMCQIGRGIGPIISQLQNAQSPAEKEALEKKLIEMVEEQKSNINRLGALSSNAAGDAAAPVQIRTPLEEYLKTAVSPRLMLGCGHDSATAKTRTVKLSSPIEIIINGEKFSTAERLRHKADLSHKHDFHSHEGWYTADSDAILSADFCGSLTSAESLSYIFPENAFQLVMEEISDGKLYTKALFSGIARSLKAGGSLVANMPFTQEIAAMQNVIRMGDPVSVGEFWLIGTDVEENALTKTADSQFKIKRNYSSVDELRNKLWPLFNSVGFSQLEVHTSLGLAMLVANVQGTLSTQPKDQKVSLGTKTMTYGEMIEKGPHPEASAVDPYFTDKCLGSFYLIARK